MDKAITYQTREAKISNTVTANSRDNVGERDIQFNIATQTPTF